MQHDDHDHSDTDHSDHHAHMIAEYRRRFFVSLELTVPVVLLSPMIHGWIPALESLSFPGDMYALFALSAAIYGYGGWPFLRDAVGELQGEDRILVKPGEREGGVRRPRRSSCGRSEGR